MEDDVVFVYIVYMFEIELKAHADDRKSVIKALESFAEYSCAVQKDDEYWKGFRNGSPVQVRIRKETPFVSREVSAAPKSERQKDILFTYKRKEVRTAEDGTSMEINDEKECRCSDSTAIEAFLEDCGFTRFLEKHKTVLAWTYENALLELCTVNPLGDFLEIEIMSESDEKEKTDEIHGKLLELLTKCGISHDKIEKRYYSELLESIKDV